METRIIHTRIWEDEWFSGLSKNGKLLFLYLISNKEIGKSGAFERTKRVISFDTGISMEDLDIAFIELEGKVDVIGSYVFVRNTYKYQNYFKESATDKQKQGVVNEINRLPEEVRDLVVDQILTSYNLVSNYILTRINKKEKIINKKEETKKVELSESAKKIVERMEEIRKVKFGVQLNRAKDFVDRSVLLKTKKKVWLDADKLFREEED